MKEGFNLKKLEIFNWWTFDSEIETFYIDADITVLSGSNGSGKSTLVDALVTLLVPNIQRKYNLSANDTGKKKDRNELTYVKWAYKNKDSDEWIKTVFLRWNKIWESTFSVIVWCFNDESTSRLVSLAIFFRTTITGLEKFFVISTEELFIKEDFIIPINRWGLKTLNQFLSARKDITVYKKFKDYSQDYHHIFGLRDNAINLFNKVVSLKEIKNLNEFFRENMLDKNSEIELEFQECEKNYIWVRDIYNMILESEDKLAILEPFVIQKKQYLSKTKHLDDLKYLTSNLTSYFNSFEKELLEDQLWKLSKKKDLLVETIWYKDQNIINNREEIQSIRKLIEDNDTIKRINELQKNIQYLESARAIKEEQYNNYISNLDKIELSFDNNEESFENNLALIEDKKIESKEKLKTIDEDFFQKKTEQWDLETHISKKKEELDYYEKKQSLLPPRLDNIRALICRETGIYKEELPFVCELIRVKASEEEWTIWIEKLLNSFWQEMLVSEKIISKVNGFVDSANLKWKLKYNKVVDKSINNLSYEDNSVFTKLDIKHATQFAGWLKFNLIKRYDYVCLDDVNHPEYNKLAKVLTKSGLIKNKRSYIKDDRLFNISNFILGWNTKKKIEILKESLWKLENSLIRVNKSIIRTEDLKNNIENIKRIFIKLEDIKSFQQIDYISIKKQIEKSKIEIKKLENTAFSKELKDYKKKLDILEADLSNLEFSKNKLLSDKWVVENDLTKYKKKIKLLEYSLSNIDIETIKKKFEESKYNLRSISNLNIENISEQEKQIREKLDKRKDNLLAEMTTLTNKMDGTAFYYKTNKLSVSENNELGSNMPPQELRDYLENEYKKIHDEQLYKYKEKFEKEFQSVLLTKLFDFYRTLENEYNSIKSKIFKINDSLNQIDYSNNTYVEIDLKDNKQKIAWILDFKKEYKENIINKTSFDMEDKRKTFESVQQLMEKMISKDNNKWKNDVIDVRNWFIFKIKEIERETNELKDIYESSGWKSWWQTIKLAYSILAAALIYQYGIKDSDENLIRESLSKSFRLVLIDEVFAKLDPDNSRYVLELFKKIGLQLFIITPTGSISLLEDYVKVIYFVSNQNGEKSFSKKIDIISRKPLEEEIISKKEKRVWDKEEKNNDKKTEKKLKEFEDELLF